MNLTLFSAGTKQRRPVGLGMCSLEERGKVFEVKKLHFLLCRGIMGFLEESKTA